MHPLLTDGLGADARKSAYSYCERLAKSHHENFTVGSLLIPREKRPHVYAVYAYCRWVDDLGDESPSTLSASLADMGWQGWGDPESRQGTERKLELLDLWQEQLELCYTGTPSHPVMVALQDTISTFEIPREPFLKLIEANRMEQRSNRYPTYDDLLCYCDHSANPVGHLFLYLFGYGDRERQRLSDFTCTALQLANFWQDVARDYRIGRIYLPLEDMERFGYSEEELEKGVANQAFRSLMDFEVVRARSLFGAGAPLVDTLDGRLKTDVALFTMGGTAVLDAIERQDYDVLSRRPSLSRAKKAGLFLSTWLKMKLGLRVLPA